MRIKYEQEERSMKVEDRSQSQIVQQRINEVFYLRYWYRKMLVEIGLVESINIGTDKGDGKEEKNVFFTDREKIPVGKVNTGSRFEESGLISVIKSLDRLAEEIVKKRVE